MKRKTILKLTAFVLFGICSLSAQKAEATITPLQGEFKLLVQHLQ